MCTEDFPSPHQIPEREEKWKMCKIIYDKFHFILKQMLYDMHIRPPQNVMYLLSFLRLFC